MGHVSHTAHIWSRLPSPSSSSASASWIKGAAHYQPMERRGGRGWRVMRGVKEKDGVADSMVAALPGGNGVVNSPSETRKEQVLALTEGDVVEYCLHGKLGVGVVTWEGKVHPLCRRASSDSNAFYYDEDRDCLQEPPEAIVVRTLNAYFEQRQVDRRHNPHGEHSEEVFFINEELSPACVVVVREEE